MILLAVVVLTFAFTLSAFWPGAPAPGVVEPTPAPTPGDPRVAQGRTLAASTFGCVACHSVDGSRSVGPTWRGLFGSQVQLDNGQTVQADAAFVSNKIRNPDQITVAGFPKGVMGPAIQPYQTQLGQQATLDAVVAYIQSLQ